MARKIFIAGHDGMVGSAILRRLKARQTAGEDLEIVVRSRSDLDLTDQRAVQVFMDKQRPDEVILAAAKVGGIHANATYPADFIYNNLMIQSNVIHQAFKSGVAKLLFLGSSCIYPKLADQPITEDALMTGPLEPTNEPYAIAKIAGLKLCESYNRQYGVDYRSVMPTNLYGPGDNFDPETCHVLPAMIRRFYDAKIRELKCVTIWGTGAPKREFLHVDDMASGSLFVLDLPKTFYLGQNMPMQSHLNLGTGRDISILELARLVADTVGYQGRIATDPTRADGAPRKLLDVSKLSDLGWTPVIPLREGIAATYEWFCAQGEAGLR